MVERLAGDMGMPVESQYLPPIGEIEQRVRGLDKFHAPPRARWVIRFGVKAIPLLHTQTERSLE
jgi:hypothetical protein